MMTRDTLQNRFLVGVVAALAASVLIVFASLTQAVIYVPAYA
jgi:hypothetical protein